MNPDTICLAITAVCNLAIKVHDDIPPERRVAAWEQTFEIMDHFKAMLGGLKAHPAMVVAKPDAR